MADDSFEDVVKMKLCINPKHAEKSFPESFPESVRGFWQGLHDGWTNFCYEDSWDLNEYLGDAKYEC